LAAKSIWLRYIFRLRRHRFPDGEPRRAEFLALGINLIERANDKVRIIFYVLLSTSASL